MHKSPDPSLAQWVWLRQTSIDLSFHNTKHNHFIVLHSYINCEFWHNKFVGFVRLLLFADATLINPH